VSITIGLWSTLITYIVSIPLGIRKAVRDGSKFDSWTTTVMITASSIPSFLIAIVLIVLFAGGSFWQWFPLRGLTSSNFDELSRFDQIKDYFWHITLPLLKPTFLVALLLRTVQSFKVFDIIYATTSGGPGTATTVLNYHIFTVGMTFFDMGYAAALANILLVIIAALSIMYILVLERQQI
jgi:microcin C transport system permease protein